MDRRNVLSEQSTELYLRYNFMYRTVLDNLINRAGKYIKYLNKHAEFSNI